VVVARFDVGVVRVVAVDAAVDDAADDVAAVASAVMDR